MMTTAKKVSIILGWLMLSIAALGQTTNNGNVVSTGQVNYGAGGGGGAPLTYNARTDLCVTGSETGCSGLGLNFQMRPGDAAPFAGYPAAPMNAAATDPDFHSYLVMATDWTLKNPTNTWQINNGDQAAFSLDSTKLLIVQNGNLPRIVLLNPSAIHANQSGTCVGCVTASAIIGGTVEPNCGTSCTKLDSQGNAVWSLVPGEGNVLYELAGDNVTVNRLVIQPGGNSFSRTPYVQFTSDTPVACSVLPANYVDGGWNGVIKVSTDGSFTYATGGAGDWLPSHAYASPDDFIFPQMNNGGAPNKAFQATVSGSSGSSEPNWNVTCPNAGNTCTDGGVTWTNIGSIKGQGNGFDVLNYRPGKGCSRINTFIGKVYRATGSSEPAGTLTTDDNLICPAYGVTYPGTCPLTDNFTIHDGGSVLDSHYVSFAPNGGGSANSCQVSGNCSCAATSANYLGGWSDSYSVSPGYSSATFDTVYDPSNTPHSLYKAVGTVPAHAAPAPGGTAYWAPADQACFTYVWQTNSTIVRPCMARGSSMGGDCDMHEVQGYLNQFKGTYLSTHLWSRPSVNGAANPGLHILPPQGLPAQHHGTYLNAGTQDLPPMGVVQTSVPTATYTLGGNPPGSAPANLPWYGEFIAVSTDGLSTVYRFLHIDNTGSEPNYNAQNNVGAISEDGQFAAVTTDMMGTRGSTSPDWIANHTYALGTTMFPTSGNAGGYDFQILTAPSGNSGGTEPAWCQTSGCTTTDGGVTWTNLGASCNQLRAMYSPATSAAFSLNDMVFPTTKNNAGNIFKATQEGTTGSALPNWDGSCSSYGQTCADGGVIWTNIGPNDCRWDVMLVDLLSAH